MNRSGTKSRLNVMREWQAACLRLQRAFDGFEATSYALLRDTHRSCDSYLDYVDLQANMRALAAKAPQMRTMRDAKLGNAFGDLELALRDFESTVPFKKPTLHKLPVEILSWIFSILVGWDNFDVNREDYSRGYSNGPFNHALRLSAVNQVWRHVMITTRSFWSRIEVHLDCGEWHIHQPKYINECLQRIGDAPIHIHIVSAVWFDGRRPEVRRMELPECLRGRPVASLNVSLQDFQRKLLVPILSAWRTNTRPVHDLTSLKIILQSPCNRLVSKPKLLPDHLHRHLSPKLHTLNLRHAHLHWDQVRFSELVDLQLDAIPRGYSPSLKDLERILTASSRLRIFSFSNMQVGSTYRDPLLRIRPVRLPRLQHLSLRELDITALSVLLCLVQPGGDLSVVQVLYETLVDLNTTGSNASPESPIFEFTTKDILEAFKLVGDFCSKYKPPILCLHFPTSAARELENQLSEFADSLNHLHTLDIGGFYLNRRFIELFSTHSGGPHQTEFTPPRTNPRRLRLYRCVIRLSDLHQIISSSTFSSLVLDECSLQFDDAPSRRGYPQDIRLPPDAFMKWVESVNSEIQIDTAYGEDVGQQSRIMGLPWWLP